MPDPASARAGALTIAVLGAESTGKTTLCHELAGTLRTQGLRVAVVPEHLRAWRERAGRMPDPHECDAIAQAQERGVAQAAHDHDVVIADTTALGVAVYGARLLPDDPLYCFALERLRGYGLVLLAGLDLPWTPDGLERSASHAREPVDALVRQGLDAAGAGWRVIYGQGAARTRNALEAVAAVAPWAWQARPEGDEVERWSRLKSTCEKCGDAGCEHRLFTGLTGRPTSPEAGPPER